LRKLVLLPILVFFVSLSHGQAPSPIAPEVHAAFLELQKAPFRAHMAFLADDLLEGRGTGKRGHEIAARYVAAQFEAMEIKPAGQDGTYFQRVPLRKVSVQPDKCAVAVMENGATSELKWGQDFVMYGNPSNADSSAEAPLVFVGYGVRTPNGQYDDYAGADVKGKIVVLLSGAPPSLPSELRAHLSDRHEKLRAARDHGAVGAIVLRTPMDEKRFPWSFVVSAVAFPSMYWLGRDGNLSDTFPELRATALLSLSASEALFQHAAKSWADVLRDAAASKPQSVPLPVNIKLRTASLYEAVSSPNVVAVIPGSDPKLSQEYVVYSAHVDHLGIGRPVNGDSIYNGAADDASGTAALLLIAKAFKSLPHAPARSILFLGTTGEEAGLLGSDYFVHYPTVPIEKIVADINMDGASLFYKFKDIVPLGAGDSTLEAVVQRAAASLGLKVSPDPEPEQNLFIRADQYSFVRQGVPSIFVSEGNDPVDPKFNAKEFNDEWSRTRYHSPSDDMSQVMDLDASVEFMRVDFLVGYDIAQDPKRPIWKPGDFFGETFGHR
jgi:Peptidase family M28/PA domain